MPRPISESIFLRWPPKSIADLIGRSPRVPQPISKLIFLRWPSKSDADLANKFPILCPLSSSMSKDNRLEWSPLERGREQR